MSERENQEMNEPKTDDYRYRWDYGAQCAYEAQKQKQTKRRGAWTYAIVMASVFAACLALLVGVLIWYSAGGTVNDRIETVAKKVSPSTVLIHTTDGEGSYGYGTGFFIRSDGYIATNYHVVENGRNVQVTLYSGQRAAAQLIGYSAIDDLAVLKIQGMGYPTVKIGDSDALRVGELAVAIGHPSGADGSLPWTTTHGIVSALDRVVSVSGGGKHGEMTMIQTDAPVNPGNSGGPLCNSRGEVIGIVTSKHTTYEGIGFAIPINNAMELLREIVETGSADGIESNVAKVRPTIGIGVRDIVEGDVYYDMQGKKYTAEKTGVLVSSVDETGAAYGSLQVRDIIIAMDGKTVETQNDLRELLYKHKSGDETTLVIWRDGQSKSVKIRLG
ncbi:MAG: trypsin-like peptidase domain-containing protein [Clostridia bacterium]|nr:trypsin-like peptidase domain-containing protein [Clostridia bacterium]